MAEQKPRNDVPDPARSYGREKPEAESGMGRLDNNVATPADGPDRMGQAVTHGQAPRQINAHDLSRPAPGAAAAGGADDPPLPGGADDSPLPGRGPAPVQPDHSMLEEEPDGWDLAPQDIHDPRQQRHPRPDGKGGTH